MALECGSKQWWPIKGWHHGGWCFCCPAAISPEGCIRHQRVFCHVSIRWHGRTLQKYQDNDYFRNFALRLGFKAIVSITDDEKWVFWPAVQECEGVGCQVYMQGVRNGVKIIRTGCYGSLDDVRAVSVFWVGVRQVSMFFLFRIVADVIYRCIYVFPFFWWCHCSLCASIVHLSRVSSPGRGENFLS